MKITDQKFQVFYPDVYDEKERAAVDALRREVERSGGVGPAVDRTETASQAAMLEYARLWNPYDPLYNDPEYAAGTRWRRLPALPCYIFEENISGFPMMDDIGDELGNVFYYANDGGDIELFRPVYDGDVISFKSTKQEFRDVTPTEGDTLRQFSLYGEAEMRDADGNLVGVGKGYGRNAMMRILEGYVPTELEQTYEWLESIPPVHITTEAEWERIRTLWKNERVRGAKTLYWEDVKIGDEPIPTCSGPVSDMDMFRLHGAMIRSMPDARGFMEMGEELMTDAYGQKLHFMARHYSYCRVPGARAVFYNFTARNFLMRMVTNWMGDDGFIRAFKWRFQNLFECMSKNEPGRDILAKVPYMRGKYVNRHGMEGDTAVCRGYVTGKYKKDGKALVDLSCWAETLDGDVIQVMEFTVELPCRQED